MDVSLDNHNADVNATADCLDNNDINTDNDPICVTGVREHNITDVGLSCRRIRCWMFVYFSSIQYPNFFGVPVNQICGMPQSNIRESNLSQETNDFTGSCECYTCIRIQLKNDYAVQERESYIHLHLSEFPNQILLA